MKTVTKRSGHTVPYNREKIYNAIAGANNDGGHKMSPKDIDEVTSQVEWDIQDRENVSVEENADGFIRMTPGEAPPFDDDIPTM